MKSWCTVLFIDHHGQLPNLRFDFCIDYSLGFLMWYCRSVTFSKQTNNSNKFKIYYTNENNLTGLPKNNSRILYYIPPNDLTSPSPNRLIDSSTQCPLLAAASEPARPVALVAPTPVNQTSAPLPVPKRAVTPARVFTTPTTLPTTTTVSTNGVGTAEIRFPSQERPFQ